ncbi:MAG: hypothetical protein JNM27_23175 [Leptospirales bacterium]|nr:hypothetical protein [Leptospirales bacterium]
MRQILPILAIVCSGALSAAPLTFGSLTFTSDGSPTSKKEQDFGLSLSRDDGIALVTKVIAWKDKPEVFLERFMESMKRDYTVAKKNPDQIASGKTKSGVPFVAQSRVLQKGQETVYALYYAFGTSADTMQAFVIMSDNAAKFRTIVAVWSPLLETVAISRPASTAANTQANNQPATATHIFEQTGPAADQFVSGTIQAESAKLTPVKFTISGGTAVSVVGLYDSDLILTPRNEKGEIFLIEKTFGTYANTERALAVSRMTNFDKPKATAITRLSVLNLAKKAGEKGDAFFLSNYPIHQLQILPKGLILGMTLEDHNAFMSFDENLASPAFVAKPSQLAKIGNGWKTGGDASTVLSTRAGNAWLFVKGPEDTSGKNYSTTPFFMERQSDGGWSAKRVEPTINGKPVPRKNLYAFFAGGCVDENQNFVNAFEDFLYRLTPAGEMIPLGRLGFPTKGIYLTGPTIAPNGDIWYALATKIDSVAVGKVDTATGYTEHRQTWFSVGDRSRLIRLRPKANRTFDIGEISIDTFYEAVAKSGGPKVNSVGLWTITQLLPDFKTGGIIVVDTRNKVLTSLKPE